MTAELFIKSPGRYSQLIASKVEYPAANHLDLITFGLIVPSLTKLVSLFFSLVPDTLVEKAGGSILSEVYEVEGRSRKRSSTAFYSALSASIRFY
jgi:hypothetical protein